MRMEFAIGNKVAIGLGDIPAPDFYAGERAVPIRVTGLLSETPDGVIHYLPNPRSGWRTVVESLTTDEVLQYRRLRERIALRVLKAHGYDLETPQVDPAVDMETVPAAVVQSMVNEWREGAFGEGDIKRAFAHLLEEVAELGAALGLKTHAFTSGPMPAHGSVKEEIADLTMLLCGMSQIAGFYQHQAVLEKLEVNKARTWEVERGAKGYRKHIEEDTSGKE